MEAATTLVSLFREELPAWWLRQMRDLLRSGRRAPAGPDATIVEIREFGEDPAASSGLLIVRRSGRETVAAPLDLARGAALAHSGPAVTGLRLPRELVLRREVVLPLAAARDIAAALRFEMDRLTPFAPAELFWGVTDIRREPSRLRLTLMIALREPVERLLTALRAVDLVPAFLETEAGRIELSGRPGGAGSRTALYAACGLLALLCLAIPMARQQLAMRAVTGQIARLEPASRIAAALHSRLAVAAAGEAAVAAAQRSGDALQAIAGLTSALPDDTWLSSLALQSGDLTIDGQSANAARLISLLAAAHLTKPQFVAPVTRAPGGKADLFSIHATVAP